MAAAILKLAATNTTNLTKVKNGYGTLKGIAATNTTAAAVFLKFYWFVPSATAAAPTVGTTVPDITITIPALGTTTGTVLQSWPDGLSKAGEFYFAITNLVADNDATAVAAGSAVVSVFFE
jgi:hypothetical protein